MPAASTPEELERGCYPNTYAWELTNVKRLRKPVPFKHPSGAVIWVMLPDNLPKLELRARSVMRTRRTGSSSRFLLLCWHYYTM